MQALDLNLASRPFRNNTLLWVGYSLAVLLLLAFSWWNVATWVSNSSRLEELRSRVNNYDRSMTDFALRSQKARREAGRFDLERLRNSAEKANDVIAWKAFSWTRLFNLLEEIQPYRVKMLSVRPTFYATERRSSRDDLPEGAIPVNVQGVAETLETLLEFERELINDPHFSRVEPEAQGLLDAANKEIKFDLGFFYFPEPRDEGDQDGGRLESLFPDDPATPRQFDLMVAAWEAEQRGESGEPDAVPDEEPAAVEDGGEAESVPEDAGGVAETAGDA